MNAPNVVAHNVPIIVSVEKGVWGVSSAGKYRLKTKNAINPQNMAHNTEVSNFPKNSHLVIRVGVRLKFLNLFNHYACLKAHIMVALLV